jgi:hypothetical protein
MGAPSPGTLTDVGLLQVKLDTKYKLRAPMAPELPRATI